MSFIARTTNFVVSLCSADRFYKIMNWYYLAFHNEYFMLHYPYFENEEHGFIQSQKNLTNHCLSKISPLEGKTVLDIGCGNGIQGLHILEEHNPAKYIGIDISSENIRIAKEVTRKNGRMNMDFCVDNAQDLASIADDSVDVVINIESALHYPDKVKFLQEINRVLKPGGEFMIADVLTKRSQGITEPERSNRWGVFHHWTLEQYHYFIPSSNLKLISTFDISNPILKGFLNYRNWFRDRKVRGFFRRWISEMLVFLNAKVYAHMYARSRAYFIFAGIKPLPLEIR